MREDQNKSSWFVSRLGLLSLMFFAVLSIYFQAWLISTFLCFAFLLSLSSGIWSRSVLRKAEFQVLPESDFCYAGELLELRFRLQNRSFLPLVWLDICIPTGDKPMLCLEDCGEEAADGIHQRFAWLLWQQKLSWEERVRTLRRGIVSFDEVKLQAGDGFGLSAAEMKKTFAGGHPLFIYPERVSVRIQPFLKITQEAAAKNRGQAEDITILKSIRPYQSGDSAKRINWRLLASGGGMQVNVYEMVMPGCAAFVLDLESFLQEEIRHASDHSEYTVMTLRETELEKMFSFVSSCMMELAAQGIQTALVIPAYEGHEAVIAFSDEAESNLQDCMEQFACIDYQGSKTDFPYEEFWHCSHKFGTVYLCSWSEKLASWHRLAEELGRSRICYLLMEGGKDTGEWNCLSVSELVMDGEKGERYI